MARERARLATSPARTARNARAIGIVLENKTRVFAAVTTTGRRGRPSGGQRSASQRSTASAPRSPANNIDSLAKNTKNPKRATAWFEADASTSGASDGACREAALFKPGLQLIGRHDRQERR